jgi:oligopeptide transport system permease protein
MAATALPVESITNQPTLTETRPPTLWRQILRSKRVLIGGGILGFIIFACVVTMPVTMRGETPLYAQQKGDLARAAPNWKPMGWFGYDTLGRSVFIRCLLGGTISLAVGLAAAAIAVALGVTVGLLAGYRGGWIDSLLMRSVDVLYGLPYVLLVILFKIAFERPLVEGLSVTAVVAMVLFLALVVGLFVVMFMAHGIARMIGGLWLLLLAIACGSWMLYAVWNRPPGAVIAFKMNPQAASMVVLFSAIGLVSWLTMARVIRGQVLSLRGQPFIEACRAMGLKEGRIFVRHILPNLIGPITVYATLTVPSAMLQESFLSFLGVGINAPLPSWGNLASEGVEQLYPRFYWWMLVFPCTLLAVTLLSLNFMGDGLRDVFDPKK